MTSMSAPEVTAPTPIPHTCPTPGVYTFPATTIVVTETQTVCGASTATVPSGTHTLGGVTTVVETSTIVTCPYATTTTAPGGEVTSVVLTTTYVCPSAGTYTIGAVTTTVTESVTEIIIPSVTTFCPGTYTAPAVVTTVVETDTIIYCPFDTPTPAPAPAPTTSAAPAASTSPASESPSMGSSGNRWAVTYTPYNDDGSCKTASSVLSDIQQVKQAGFSTVRVYSTDCNTLPNVGAACASEGLKMIIGVFIGEVGCQNGSPDVSSQISAITSWAQWDLVEMAVIGNEALNDGYCTISQLASLIGECKSAFGAAGYTGPYSTTDTVNAWQAAGMEEIVEVVDVCSANSHAYFNAATTPSQAGTFVNGQLDIVKAICSGKTAKIMESGWPTQCLPNGVATCSVENQAIALAALEQEMGADIAFFTTSNDPWKAPGACECEPWWGAIEYFLST